MDATVFAAFDDFDFEDNSNFQKGWASVKRLFNSETDSIEREYLRAKAFFFSKYIQPFDFEKYLAWKSESQSGQVTTDSDKLKFLEKSAKDDRDSLNETDASCHSSSKDHDGTDGKCSDERKLSAIEQTNVCHKELPVYLTSHPSTNEIKLQTQRDEKNECLVNKTASESHKCHNYQGKNCKSNSSNESESEESLSLTELAILLQNDLPIPGLIKLDVQPTNKDPTPSSLARKPKPWELKTSLIEDDECDKNQILDSQ